MTSLPSSSGRSGILNVAFNQDCSCIAVSTQQGVKVFSLDVHGVCHKHLVGAVSITEMLFCTSLVAYVGAGEQPALTPRKLNVINTSNNKLIQDINFTTSVLAVKMNRHRLVVVLERKAFVYELQTLQLLRSLDTPHNPKGICALTVCNEPNMLALPADAKQGVLRVYDLLVPPVGNVLCEVAAHKGALEVLAWSHDGALLASASNTGTVLRVHRMPQATKAYTFRRGMQAATIQSLVFSPASVDPPLLCACSNHSTVHMFRLEPPDRNASSAAASTAAGLLSAVMKYSVTDMVEPPRPILTVKLPCHSSAATCALVTGQRGSPEGSAMNGSSGGTDTVTLVVATLEGIVYEFAIEDLSSAHGPKYTLSGEWPLLGSMSNTS